MRFLDTVVPQVPRDYRRNPRKTPASPKIEVTQSGLKKRMSGWWIRITWLSGGIGSRVFDQHVKEKPNSNPPPG